MNNLYYSLRSSCSRPMISLYSGIRNFMFNCEYEVESKSSVCRTNNLMHILTSECKDEVREIIIKEFVLFKIEVFYWWKNLSVLEKNKIVLDYNVRHFIFDADITVDDVLKQEVLCFLWRDYCDGSRQRIALNYNHLINFRKFLLEGSLVA